MPAHVGGTKAGPGSSLAVANVTILPHYHIRSSVCTHAHTHACVFSFAQGLGVWLVLVVGAQGAGSLVQRWPSGVPFFDLPR